MSCAPSAIREALWNVRSFFLEAESLWSDFKRNPTHIQELWLHDRGRGQLLMLGSLEREATESLSESAEHWLMLANLELAEQEGGSPVVRLGGDYPSYHEAAFFFSAGFTDLFVGIARPTKLKGFDTQIWTFPESLPDNAIEGKEKKIAELISQFEEFGEQQRIVARLDLESAKAISLARSYTGQIPDEEIFRFPLGKNNSIPQSADPPGPGNHSITSIEPRFTPPPCPKCGSKVRVTSTTQVKRYLKCSECTWKGFASSRRKS